VGVCLETWTARHFGDAPFLLAAFSLCLMGIVPLHHGMRKFSRTVSRFAMGLVCQVLAHRVAAWFAQGYRLLSLATGLLAIPKIIKKTPAKGVVAGVKGYYDSGRFTRN
jgi:hypothetical protein